MTPPSTGDIHARIEALAAQAALAHAAQRKIEAAMPSTFEHEGRTYYLRTRLTIQFEIFDAPGVREPLMRGAMLLPDQFGHVPGH